MSEFAGAVWDVVYTTAALLWMAAWALVLGYAFSSAIEVFVKPAEAARRLGGGGVREVGLAAGLGFISSSCSFEQRRCRKSTVPAFFALYPKPDEDVEGVEKHYRDEHMPTLEDWPNVASARIYRVIGIPRADAPPSTSRSSPSSIATREGDARQRDGALRGGRPRDAAAVGRRPGHAPRRGLLTLTRRW